MRGYTHIHTHTLQDRARPVAHRAAPLPPGGICSVVNLCSRASLWDQKEAGLQLRSHSCLHLYSLPYPTSLTLNKSVERESPSLVLLLGTWPNAEPYRTEKWDWAGRRDQEGMEDEGEGGWCLVLTGSRGCRQTQEAVSPVGGEFHAPLSSGCVGPSSEVWPRVQTKAIRPISPLNPTLFGHPESWRHLGTMPKAWSLVFLHDSEASPESSHLPFFNPRGSSCGPSCMWLFPRRLCTHRERCMENRGSS